MQYLSTADLSTVNLSFYCFVSANCLPVYRRPVYRLPVFQFLCICQLPMCLPPTCSPMFTDYRLPVYLSSYSFASANCLPVYRRPVQLCPLTTLVPPTFLPLPVFLFLCICQLPTCLQPTCQPMSTDYLCTADLSTADTYSSYLLYAMSQPVNRRPVYRLPVFLFLSNCQLPTCLPPMSTYVH